MQVAVIDNHSNHPDKHKWMTIFYMIVGAVCLIIDIIQRISVNVYYASRQFECTVLFEEKIFVSNRH